MQSADDKQFGLTHIDFGFLFDFEFLVGCIYVEKNRCETLLWFCGKTAITPIFFPNL